MVTHGASREPASDEQSDGEADGDEGVGEVALRPRLRSDESDAPGRPRGEKATAERCCSQQRSSYRARSESQNDVPVEALRLLSLPRADALAASSPRAGGRCHEG
jgi:hypothetical protein